MDQKTRRGTPRPGNGGKREGAGRTAGKAVGPYDIPDPLRAEKTSVSLPAYMLAFLDTYGRKHGFVSKTNKLQLSKTIQHVLHNGVAIPVPDLDNDAA